MGAANAPNALPPKLSALLPKPLAPSKTLPPTLLALLRIPPPAFGGVPFGGEVGGVPFGGEVGFAGLRLGPFLFLLSISSRSSSDPSPWLAMRLTALSILSSKLFVSLSLFLIRL